MCIRDRDGTTKIFLNMASKNDSKELISLLQYMKDTRLDNPEIKVKDERLIAVSYTHVDVYNRQQPI